MSEPVILTLTAAAGDDGTMLGWYRDLSPDERSAVDRQTVAHVFERYGRAVHDLTAAQADFALAWAGLTFGWWLGAGGRAAAEKRATT